MPTVICPVTKPHCRPAMWRWLTAPVSIFAPHGRWQAPSTTISALPTSAAILPLWHNFHHHGPVCRCRSAPPNPGYSSIPVMALAEAEQDMAATGTVRSPAYALNRNHGLTRPTTRHSHQLTSPPANVTNRSANLHLRKADPSADFERRNKMKVNL